MDVEFVRIPPGAPFRFKTTNTWHRRIYARGGGQGSAQFAPLPADANFLLADDFHALGNGANLIAGERPVAVSQLLAQGHSKRPDGFRCDRRANFDDVRQGALGFAPSLVVRGNATLEKRLACVDDANLNRVVEPLYLSSFRSDRIPDGFRPYRVTISMAGGAVCRLANPSSGLRFSALAEIGPGVRRPDRVAVSFHISWRIEASLPFRPAAPQRAVGASSTAFRSCGCCPAPSAGLLIASSPSTPFRVNTAFRRSVMNAVNETAAAEPVSGVEIFVPLAKLKKSPCNRRTRAGARRR